MDINTGIVHLEKNERVIRAENIVYTPECMDFYVAPLKSYKRYMKNQKFQKNLISSNFNNNINPYSISSTTPSLQVTGSGAGKDKKD